MENMSLMMTTLISSFSVFLHFLWLSRGWLNPPEIKGRRCGAGEKVSLQSKLWLTLSLGVSWDLANNRHHIRLSVHMSPCHNIEIISPGIRHLPNRALRTFIHFLDSPNSFCLLWFPLKAARLSLSWFVKNKFVSSTDSSASLHVLTADDILMAVLSRLLWLRSCVRIWKHSF